MIFENFKVRASATVVALSLGICGTASAATFNGDVPDGWIGVGNAGSGTPDGVVTAAPTASGNYTYVSTSGGTTGVGSLPGVGGTGSPTNGSTLTTSTFSAVEGDLLEFFFNFVTTDGGGFADYAWARLLSDTNEQIALLFTARTTAIPGGNTVPGFSMPDPAATLDPGNVTIKSGTNWSAVGSGCWSTGCGHTGWVKSMFKIQTAGVYKLQFGVTNWNDTAYQTGMAIAGANIGGKPIDPDEPGNGAVVPLPAGAWLLLGGLGAFAAVRRKKAA